jgi:hypothetical protein
VSVGVSSIQHGTIGRLLSDRIYVDHSRCAANGADIRKEEPTVSSVAHRGLVHVGMDVSKDSIVVAVLPPDRDVAEVDKIFNDEESVRRLFKRLGRPSGPVTGCQGSCCATRWCGGVVPPGRSGTTAG